MPVDLSGIRLFSDMPERERRSAEQQFKEVRHPAGAEVMIRGQSGVGFMVLLDGQAEVKTADGRTHALKRGDHFGEMALLDREGRSATVVAKSDIVVGAIPEWSFKAFLLEHPEVSYRLLEAMSERLRGAERA